MRPRCWPPGPRRATGGPDPRRKGGPPCERSACPSSAWPCWQARRSGSLGQDDEGVSSETLFEITIPADALPEALEKVNIETLTVAAGVDVSIGVENESLRGKALYVDSGELVLEPMVDALLRPQDAALGSAPVIAPAAEEVLLLPGDLVFLPAIPFDELREDAVIRIANPGSEPARMIGFHTHERGGQFPGFPAGIGFTYHSAVVPDAQEVEEMLELPS